MIGIFGETRYTNALATRLVHPTTGRFHTVILHGRECAWNPDKEFKNFVVNNLKSSGYDPEVFGH